MKYNDNQSISKNDEIDTMPVSFLPYPDPPAEAAFYGLAGEIVRTIEPNSEADPMALLIQFHIAFGNALGRTAYAKAEADKHFTNEFATLVGETAKGRKGTSWGYIRNLFEQIDHDWTNNRVQSGLSSGEGMAWQVRDPIVKTEPIREKKQITGYQQVTVDEGINDKRLLVYESEFAGALRVMQRDGNTLSAKVRDAWDGRKLNSMTKNDQATATDAHISIVGHITREELQRYMDRTELANGLANRFLWIATKRSKALPNGGEEVNFSPFRNRLKQIIERAKTCGEIVRDEAAQGIWNGVYENLSNGQPGMLGAATGRAEAHVMRLSVLYALENGSNLVKAEHLLAALALVSRCVEK